MSGWLTRLVFGGTALLILYFALRPTGAAFGQLGRGVDTLTRTQGGGRAMPHIVAFESAAVALTGQQPGSGAADTPKPPQPLGLMDRLFSDKPDPTARAQLQDLAAAAPVDDDRRIEVKKYVPGKR